MTTTAHSSIFATVTRHVRAFVRAWTRPTDEQLCHIARNAIIDNQPARFREAINDLTRRRSMLNVAYLCALADEVYEHAWRS